MDVEEVLKLIMVRFNEKAMRDLKLRSELKDVTRKIEVQMRDDETYNFLLQNCQLSKFARGSVESPDIRIITDTDTFEGIVTRRIGPMKALATGRLKIEASLEDKLRIRKLL